MKCPKCGLPLHVFKIHYHKPKFGNIRVWTTQAGYARKDLFKEVNAEGFDTIIEAAKLLGVDIIQGIE